MFDEPTEDPSERTSDPATAAREKADEFRMFAELAAVFEGPRKFDAGVEPGLDADVARQVQRGVATLAKARAGDAAALPASAAAAAAEVLTLNDAHALSTNDYHVHRRPGEVMVVRWLAGDQVDAFYDRLQAHFDAGLNAFRQDERQAKEWKGDPATRAYLDALDKVEVDMAARFRRADVRAGLFALSTQTADEMNVAYLCDHVMNVPAATVVGRASAPPDEPTEKDLAWFFKLFLLRGTVARVDRMCFFTFMQKANDDYDFGE